MQLQHATPILDINQLPREFDLVIAASGFEKRASYIPQLLSGVERRKGIALGFMDRAILSRRRNDKIFGKLDYELVPADGNSGESMEIVLYQFFKGFDRKRAAVLIDYTSMTRNWYASALNFFRHSAFACDQVDLYMTYAPSKYSPPQPPVPNSVMEPIAGFGRLELPNRKSALVVGLGYEQERALGLLEYVEPAKTFAYYTDPAYDKRFVKTVLRNNRYFLNKIGIENTFAHPLGDLRTTESHLSSLCHGLRREYRVILAPLGPKPFVLLCLLMATKYPFLDVWRVSAGERSNTYDRAHIGEVLTCAATFTR
ncbi:MAG: hypothetical protein ACKVRP_06035 [Bacteroidota bacterium]